MKNGLICAVGLCGQSVFLSIDHFHSPEETVSADSIFSEPGGKAYNQAVAVSQLGEKSIFIGAVGEDQNADICRSFLANKGIESHLMVCKDTNTAYAVILTDKKGENKVTVYRGAADNLSAAYIDSHIDILKKCSVFLLGLECPLEVTLAMLDIAEKYKIKTIFNPAPAKSVDSATLNRFDIITPNIQEAKVLFGLSDFSVEKLCAVINEKKLKTVIVTMGADGALLIDEGCCIKFPAKKCCPVDTTGAGDCFNAALAVYVSREKSLIEAIEFAINASSLSVMKKHVMCAMPSEKEVMDSFIALHYEILL